MKPGYLYDTPISSLTTGQVISDRAKTYGDKIFLRYLNDDRAFSYSDIDRLTNSLSHGLLAREIGHGSHIGVMMENSPEVLLTFFALGKVGAVSVALHAAAKGQLLAYFINQADITAIICDARFAERIGEIKDQIPQVQQLIMLEDGSVPTGAADAFDAINFSSLFHDRTDPCGVDVKFSDAAFILFTSGTTGPSKPILLSHSRTLGTALINTHTHGYRDTDTFYLPLPLSHSGSIQGSAYIALLAGGSLALSRRFSVSSFWNEINSVGATIVTVLSSMTNFLWKQPPSENDANNSIRLVVAVPVPTFAAGFEKRFGLRIVTGFGLSDYGTLTAFTLLDPPAKMGSMGRVRFGYDVKIFDENDFEVPPGTPGELVARPTVPWISSGGYYKMPEVTLAANRNGWFHTGDRAYMDSEGYFWFLDRKKDSIRRRGENVSAYEVEAALMSHPAVHDAAVYGISSDDAEEEICAAIVLSEGHKVTEEELIQHCADNLAYFMVPRFLHFTTEFPRTISGSGRIEKYKLRDSIARELYWDRDKSGVVLTR